MGIDTAEAQKIRSSSNRLPCPAPTNRPWVLQSSRSPNTLETSGSPFTTFEEERCRGRLVPRSPGTLQLHPALARSNLVHSVIQLHQSHMIKGRSVPAPILITTNGTIIGGFRDWHQAVSEGRPVVDCIEYSLNEEEALEFILINHQAAQNWNDFVRIRLALQLEPSLQKKALDNQIVGGKHKGSANLPKPEQIDVRRDIARFVGVGSRNVSNVKTILRKAHPALIDALTNGTLTIHRALKWCTLSQAQQEAQFAKYAVERATKRTIRHSLALLRKQKAGSDPLAVLRMLRNREVREPGLLVVRKTRLQRTVILLGRDFSDSHSETESESNV